MESKTIGERIIKATMSVFIAHLCFKVVGFAQFFVIGGVTETVQWECIYGFAFDGVIFSLFLIGEELIGPALLPVFIDEKEKNSEEAAWLLANTLLTFQLIILGITVLVLYLFPETLTRWITYFDADKKKENFELAVQGVRLMAPALICFSLGSTTYILLNGYKKFFLAAFGDAVVSTLPEIANGSERIGVCLLRNWFPGRSRHQGEGRWSERDRLGHGENVGLRGRKGARIRRLSLLI